MKYCSTCGTEINDGAAVCTNCGSAVSNNAASAVQLKTNKGLAKFIFLSIITFGLYGIHILSTVSDDINIAASRYDGKKTMNYCYMVLMTPITLGIYSFVWYHKMSARIGDELKRRNIDYNFSCSDFWLWDVLGSLIIVGPFIYGYKLFKATNLICADYNAKG